VFAQRTRLLIAALPRLMSDILAGLSGNRADVQLVGAVESDADVAAAAQAWDATLIVLPGAAWGPTRIRRLLAVVPRARVVTITSDGRDAAIYRLALKRMVLKDVSPDELLDEMTRRARRSPRR